MANVLVLIVFITVFGLIFIMGMDSLVVDPLNADHEVASPHPLCAK